MKRLLLGFSMFMLVSGLAGSASATIITWSSTSYTSPYAGVTVEDFSDSNLIWGATGSGALVTGTTGINAAPLGDSTQYLTVPANINDGITYTATFALGNTYNYLGLWWGSIDSYNSISFYNNGSWVYSVSGSDILALTRGADGSQTDPFSNVYVNLVNLPDFDSFTLTSTSYAMEIDNVAVGYNVPEPGTMLTLGLTLLGVAGLKRKFEL